MKRITGIAIAVAACIGCSYVGAVNATPCGAIASSIVKTTALAISGDNAEPSADIKVEQRKMVINLTTACKLGVKARAKGFTAEDMRNITADAFYKAEMENASSLSGFSSSSYATSLGFAYGE